MQLFTLERAGAKTTSVRLAATSQEALGLGARVYSKGTCKIITAVCSPPYTSSELEPHGALGFVCGTAVRPLPSGRHVFASSQHNDQHYPNALPHPHINEGKYTEGSALFLKELTTRSC